MTNPTPTNAYTPEGVTSIASACSVAEAITRIEQALTEKGMTLFAVIDHSGEAARAGLSMQEARLLIFGSPKGGTPLMVASPLLPLDLPLKALVWQDAAGQVWVSYVSPAWLAQRYHLPADLARNIAGMETLLAAAI
jgi:uncharacterized protein (DUF302 family)